MLFNTPEYILFFCIIYALFYTANRFNNLIVRNSILLLSSFYFYAALHYWYVILLLYVISVNYFCGVWISKEQEKGRNGKIGVVSAIVLSVVILVFFKYAHIFESSILLPVGLSFFTFQALTYTIDIYRQKISANKNLLEVALFVSFFPTLLSGPIERARNLIPQLQKPSVISWNNVIEGGGIFVWGLFKKMVIADRLAEYIDTVYSTHEYQHGSSLALAAFLYSIQIYCDFSGYANMAIGSGRILGFGIMQNFNFPYFANTFKEFWRRWHISLTTWFTEYVYISMGGNRVNLQRWIINISMVFLLSGIWHGATFSFILWGGMHAVLYILEHFFGPKKPNWLYSLYVFVMVMFAWIFFRVEDILVAGEIIVKICTDMFSPIYWGTSAFSTVLSLLLVLYLLVREYLLYRGVKTKMFEYVLLLIGISLLGVTNDKFVYFQF